MNENHVDYGMTKWLGFLAVAIGGVIAVGVPWVVLTNASNAGMNAITITVLSILGVFGGVSLAVTAALFSIVIPAWIKGHEHGARCCEGVEHAG